LASTSRPEDVISSIDHLSAAHVGAGSPGLLESLRRYRLGVVTATVLGALVGFGLALSRPPAYQASARVILEDPARESVFGEGRSTVDFTRYVRNAAEVARSQPVAARTAQLLADGRTATQVRNSYQVEPSITEDLFTVTAVGPTPESAVKLADTVTDAYRDSLAAENQRVADEAIAELDASRQQLRAQIEALDVQLDAPDERFPAIQAERDVLLNQITELERRIQQTQIDADLAGSGVRLVDPAVEARRVSPQPVRGALAGGILMAVAASALALWRHGQSRTAEERHDPATVLSAPLLGEIPDFRAAGVPGQTPTVTAPMSSASEAFEFVVASVAYSLRQIGGRCILITSAAPGDGKSVMTLNIAVAAGRDRQVLLLDADLRMRGLTRLLDEQSAGLQPLRQEVAAAYAHPVTVRLDDDTEIRALPAAESSADAAVYFRTPAFRQVLRSAREESDLVIVDSPPILAVAETSAIAGHVDAVVLVVNRGTRLQVLEDVAERLAFVGTPLLGYIFNRGRGSATRYGEYGSTAGAGRRGRRRTGRRRAVVADREIPKAATAPSR